VRESSVESRWENAKIWSCRRAKTPGMHPVVASHGEKECRVGTRVSNCPTERRGTVPRVRRLARTRYSSISRKKRGGGGQAQERVRGDSGKREEKKHAIVKKFYEDESPRKLFTGEEERSVS